MIEGAVNVLKPPGMTSHDVVDLARGWWKLRRIGHAGTLDPGAAGVLPLCLGRATRLSQYLLEADKAYRAEMIFGLSTDTGDAEGELAVDRGADSLTWERVVAELEHFRGDVLQVPPMASAVRVGGRRLYQLAREGREVQREPRPVKVYRLEPVAWTEGRYPRLVFDVVCSRGTYIRSLCSDLGEAVGTGGMLNFLVRTRVGPFPLEEAYTLEELESLVAQHPRGPVLPPLAVVDWLPRVVLPAAEVGAVLNGVQPEPRRPEEVLPGRPVSPTGPAPSLAVLVDEAGTLVAVARMRPGDDLVELRLDKVFN